MNIITITEYIKIYSLTKNLLHVITYNKFICQCKNGVDVQGLNKKFSTFLFLYSISAISNQATVTVQITDRSVSLEAL